MKPNFEDLSCEMIFGQAPPPIEQDEVYNQVGDVRGGAGQGGEWVGVRRAGGGMPAAAAGVARGVQGGPPPSPPPCSLRRACCRLTPRLPPLRHPHNAATTQQPCFSKQCNLGTVSSKTVSANLPCPKIDTERAKKQGAPAAADTGSGGGIRWPWQPDA